MSESNVKIGVCSKCGAVPVKEKLHCYLCSKCNKVLEYKKVVYITDEGKIIKFNK